MTFCIITFTANYLPILRTLTHLRVYTWVNIKNSSGFLKQNFSKFLLKSVVNLPSLPSFSSSLVFPISFFAFFPLNFLNPFSKSRFLPLLSYPFFIPFPYNDICTFSYPVSFLPPTFPYFPFIPLILLTFPHFTSPPYPSFPSTFITLPFPSLYFWPSLLSLPFSFLSILFPSLLFPLYP